VCKVSNTIGTNESCSNVKIPLLKQLHILTKLSYIMKKDLLFNEGVDCNESGINTPPILKGI
jgi:hypothetical protein